MQFRLATEFQQLEGGEIEKCSTWAFPHLANCQRAENNSISSPNSLSFQFSEVALQPVLTSSNFSFQ